MSMTTEDYLKFLKEVERALNHAIENQQLAGTEARRAELEGMRREVAETRQVLDDQRNATTVPAAVGMR